SDLHSKHSRRLCQVWTWFDNQVQKGTCQEEQHRNGEGSFSAHGCDWKRYVQGVGSGTTRRVPRVLAVSVWILTVSLSNKIATATLIPSNVSDAKLPHAAPRHE